jgi:hypothetical protein
MKRSVLWRRRVIWTIVGALVAVLVSAVAPTPQTAQALSGSQFNPGYIISDANFFDYNSMSAATIESFLQSQETGCTGGAGQPCLENYQVTTTSRAAAANGCAAYTGASNESASTIIYKVAQACEISPKVLLVTLQKEEGLVTSNAPTAGQYNIAMGYACPDSGACNTTYYGFYNQVYSAAWQFRQYTYSPSGWRYHIGNVGVQYSPNANCGAPTVNILDQSTANLYNYTPYQPDQAALNNLTGPGDGCSSYGNRNFWVYYWTWFGDPTGNSQPFGYFDNANPIPGGIAFSGWAIDPDTPNPINVMVSVDGVVDYNQPAGGSRPDVGALYPDKGPNHGFSGTITGLSTTTHTICVTGVNVSFGANALIGCKTIAPFTGSPIGVIDSASAAEGTITINGWMLDPDSLGPITVNATLDGQPVAPVTADGVKPGLGSVFLGYGDNHDYTVSLTSLSAGTHTVCIYGVNVGPGANGSPLCRTFAVLSGNPIGVIDSTSTAPGSITVLGWMLDPDTVGPIQVQVYVDGALQSTVTANGNKPGLDAAFPGYGDAHDYGANVTGSWTGAHQVCVKGLNVGAGTDGGLICTTVQMPSGSPFGVIDSIATQPNTITVLGWMLDPDTAGPIQVQAYVNGAPQGAPVTASGVKPGLGAVFPGYGDNHDYTATLTGSWSGTQKVCVKGINVGGGADSGMICQNAKMPTGSPFGVFDSITPGVGSVAVSGWAIDPDIAPPIWVSIQVDGVTKATILGDQIKTGLGAVFPGYNDNHLFSGTITGLTSGSHKVCGYAINVGPSAPNGLLGGCQTVVVQ